MSESKLLETDDALEMRNRENARIDRKNISRRNLCATLAPLHLSYRYFSLSTKGRLHRIKKALRPWDPGHRSRTLPVALGQHRSESRSPVRLWRWHSRRVEVSLLSPFHPDRIITFVWVACQRCLRMSTLPGQLPGTYSHSGGWSIAHSEG